MRTLRFWKEHFNHFSLEGEDHYKIYQEALFPEDNFFLEHGKVLGENTVLKKSTNELIAELQDIKGLLQQYKEKFGDL